MCILLYMPLLARYDSHLVSQKIYDILVWHFIPLLLEANKVCKSIYLVADLY